MKTGPIISASLKPLTKTRVMSATKPEAKTVSTVVKKVAGNVLLAGALIAGLASAADSCSKIINNMSEQATIFSQNLVNNLLNSGH